MTAYFSTPSTIMPQSQAHARAQVPNTNPNINPVTDDNHPAKVGAGAQGDSAYASGDPVYYSFGGQVYNHVSATAHATVAGIADFPATGNGSGNSEISIGARHQADFGIQVSPNGGYNIQGGTQFSTVTTFGDATPGGLAFNLANADGSADTGTVTVTMDIDVLANDSGGAPRLNIASGLVIGSNYVNVGNGQVRDATTGAVLASYGALTSGTGHFQYTGTFAAKPTLNLGYNDTFTVEPQGNFAPGEQASLAASYSWNFTISA